MRNIYFYWSGQSFDFGNFLAVASAAVHSTGRVVLLVDEEPLRNVWYDRLGAVPRVHIERLDVDALLSAEHAALYRRMGFVAHRSDLMSFWALARTGGMYLDTDTLTRRSLDGLPDRLLFDDGKIVHVGAMAFPPGDPLPLAMMDDFLRMPPGDFEVYQSIVYRWTRLVRAGSRPEDFGALESFSPVHWKEWEKIFTGPDAVQNPDSVHILHHYGYFSRTYTAEMDPDWLRTHPCLFSEIALPIVAELERRIGPLDALGARV